MARYVLSDRAAQDVQDIADCGFTHFGVAKTREYGVGFEDCFGQVASTPAIGLAVDELSAGVRRFKYESHWVFYVEERDGIRVVRVLQQRYQRIVKWAELGAVHRLPVILEASLISLMGSSLKQNEIYLGMSGQGFGTAYLSCLNFRHY